MTWLSPYCKMKKITKSYQSEFYQKMEVVSTLRETMNFSIKKYYQFFLILMEMCNQASGIRWRCPSFVIPSENVSLMYLKIVENNIIFEKETKM